MGKRKITVQFTPAEARILREMAFDRLFTLETIPKDERTETPQQMAAARRAVKNLGQALLAQGDHF